MPLFEFELRPLAEVIPWGRPGDLSLSWFGLTDGHYSLNCGSSRLFQYSEEMCFELDRQFPKSGRTSDWVDYQVVRLYEDMLELLPYVLAEVPKEIHEMTGSLEAYRNWRSSVGWVLEIEDDEDLDEQYYSATDWMGFRKLDSGYLIDGPKIWFWRFQGEVFLLWDNEKCVTNGISRWTAGAGMIKMPVSSLLTEIESFHLRLMTSMQDRVHEVALSNPFTGVSIDIPGLIHEQKERERSLTYALAEKSPETDWDAVLRANRELRQMPGS